VTGRDALRRAEAAGILVFLRDDGAVQAKPTPAPDLLADLRTHKVGIAALLATATRSPELPTCPGCWRQWFWRDTTDSIIGDWTCCRLAIPPTATSVDILGPAWGKAAAVMGVFPDEAADAEAFAGLLVEWGIKIVVALPDLANPRSRGTRVRGCQ
jgi:hypothetical protein